MVYITYAILYIDTILGCTLLHTRRYALSSTFGIPQPTLRRLPLYYRRLRQAAEDHINVISSEELGRSIGSSAAQVRKDLSYLPEVGRAGIGYDVVSLAAYLEDLSRTGE